MGSHRGHGSTFAEVPKTGEREVGRRENVRQTGICPPSAATRNRHTPSASTGRVIRIPLRLAPFALRALYPWVVMIGAFMLFQVGRGLADNVGPPPIVSPLATTDRVLGLGELPSITAQRWQASGVSDMARAVHLTFFLLPPGLGLALSLQGKNALFSRYAHALALAFSAGLIVYTIAPTAPPWFADNRIEILLVPDPDPAFRLKWDPNPFAAFPSMHVAVATVTACALATRYHWPAYLYPALMTWALVYLGEHYLIDAGGGLATGLIAWSVTRVFPRRATPVNQRKGADPRSGTAGEPAFGTPPLVAPDTEQQAMES